MDEVKFWETLEQEVKSILSRPKINTSKENQPSLDSKDKL